MVQRLIIVQNPDRLKEVLPYFEKHGYLEGLLKGTLVLSLTLDEFRERESILQSKGEEVLVDGKFNPIFGLDIGFYFFQKPFISMMLYYIVIMFVVLTIYTAAYYIIVFNSSWMY